ncbi:MAG: type I-B CRISPR-associated protein Cas5 [Candidatus Aminicenantes bacterium]|nr:type I-B CRISPR-associated protein Cas5 [Candidatus Aminicenantes bacterium]
MNVSVFDIFADLGHFKAPYTTTSPISLPVPSKTAVYGIIGAIIGLDKKEYLSSFQVDDCKIAIGVNRPIRKIYISENLINTKNVNKSVMFARLNSRKKAPRTQVKIEFLREPGYRIYINHKDENLLRKLDGLLEEHKSVYTVSLGLSECLANFEYSGFYKLESVENNCEFVSFDSIVPLEAIPSTADVIFDDNRYYIRAHIPLEMKPDRELLKTGDFLIEANGETIKAKVNAYYKICELGKNIMLF